MTLRPRDRLALIAFVFAIAAGAFYMLVLTPERHKAKALNAQIATQQQSLAAAQQQVAAGRAAQAKLRTEKAKLASLDLAVPAQPNMPEVLRALQGAAKAAHVQMQSITVSASNGATPSSGSGTAPSASAAGTATATPIQLTFAGGYLALENLVRRLDGFVVVSENRVRATGPLLSITSVQLSGDPNLVANLSATIYQRSAASAPAGATPTAAPATVASAAPRTAS
jgi:Type II secretion system (T2SS), protein M